MRASARADSARARGVGLGLLQFLARHDAGGEQLALARQRLLRQVLVGLGLGGVGLGLAEIGRCQQCQRGARLHALAQVGADGGHAPGEGRDDALRALLVPHQARRQLDAQHAGRAGFRHRQQGQLRVVAGVVQLPGLQHRGRGLGFGRGGAGLLAAGQGERGAQRQGAAAAGEGEG